MCTYMYKSSILLHFCYMHTSYSYSCLHICMFAGRALSGLHTSYSYTCLHIRTFAGRGLCALHELHTSYFYTCLYIRMFTGRDLSALHGLHTSYSYTCVYIRMFAGRALSALHGPQRVSVRRPWASSVQAEQGRGGGGAAPSTLFGHGVFVCI
jgi:hypothetical protein